MTAEIPPGPTNAQVRQNAESDPPQIESAKTTLAKVLLHDHRGRENAVASQDLAEHVPIKATTVRDLIPEIMAEYRVPIGTANGYFVIEDREEFTRQVERQLEQAETSRKRAQLISAAFNSGDE